MTQPDDMPDVIYAGRLSDGTALWFRSADLAKTADFATAYRRANLCAPMPTDGDKQRALDFVFKHAVYDCDGDPCPDAVLDTIRAALQQPDHTALDPELLRTALKNAVQPNYAEEQCEWVLWCGGEEHAQIILDAARETLTRAEAVLKKGC